MTSYVKFEVHEEPKSLKCVWCKYESTPFWFQTDEPFKYVCPICNGIVQVTACIWEESAVIAHYLPA